MKGELTFDVGGTTTEVLFRSPSEPSGSLRLFDETTRSLFGSGVARWVEIPAGEPAKCWKSVESVLKRCADLGLGRDDSIIGVGGGVVCDVASFAASLYMRGCGLVLVPTTLLAMVDASLGGKTGIDFMGFKNLVGTYYPASRIYIDIGALSSLPEREYHSGLAEVIKTAIIGDAELFSLLEQAVPAVQARNPTVVEEMIRRCLAVKGGIVEKDPREAGLRAVLNLGHTFGHALESATAFSGWTHGEAVAWGMGKALALGLRLGLTEAGFPDRVLTLLARYGFRLEADAGYDDLAPAFERDKKKRGGKVRFVIARRMCDVVMQEVPVSELAMVLRKEERRVI
ncbi:MAG TPA: 3-dehydroquinate synthase family protein [Spirochaetia bacterium]|nr:3-dehydroquinate synthase family protein [Spirochaetia bacterium]